MYSKPVLGANSRIELTVSSIKFAPLKTGVIRF
jgi:hypothetical protein